MFQTGGQQTRLFATGEWLRCATTVSISSHSTGKGRRQANFDKKFDNSFTRGFAAVGEPNVAVCVLPGTEIAFEQEVEYRHSLLPNQKVAERLARFRQINMKQVSVHHDALEFANRKITLLARLCEGQHATVMQLPASPRATNEAEQQKRGSLVT